MKKLKTIKLKDPKVYKNKRNNQLSIVLPRKKIKSVLPKKIKEIEVKW